MKSVESYDMFIIIQDLQGAKECSVLWAQRERLSAFGHTFGVRVDGASPRRLWPPVGGGLCRRVEEKGS